MADEGGHVAAPLCGESWQRYENHAAQRKTADEEKCGWPT
jgi:hypothetical protein